jgi:hypothetical protein
MLSNTGKAGLVEMVNNMKKNQKDLSTGLSKLCVQSSSVRLSEYHIHLVKSYNLNISKLVRDEIERIHKESMEASK